MIFYERIQDSLQYIENHLDEACSLADVAKPSGLSLSHFYKVFLSCTGFTVKGYIRGKLLARAANELVHTDRRVIDIALDAGYHSHEVFTRAFEKLYGMSPKDYRAQNKEIAVFEKHSLFGEKISEQYRYIKEDIGITASVSFRDAMLLTGMELKTSVRDTIEKDAIPLFWRNSFVPEIPDILHIKQPYVSIGYEIHHPDEDALYHMACLEVSKPTAPKGMAVKTVPPGTYAVFRTARLLNPAEYSVLIRYIYGEWLPMSGLQTAADFTMDMNYSDSYYPYDRKTQNACSHLEVLIPVKQHGG